jgi:hypothetical protein
MEQWKTRQPRRVTRESIGPSPARRRVQRTAQLAGRVNESLRGAQLNDGERERLKKARKLREQQARLAERRHQAGLSMPLHHLDARQVLGVTGSLALVIAAFAPVLAFPLAGGTLTYIGSGTPDGLLMLISSVIGLGIALAKRWIWLLVPASLTVIFAGINFVRLLGMVNEPAESIGILPSSTSGGQLQWGWAAMLIGVFLLVTAALMKPHEPRESSL